MKDMKKIQGLILKAVVNSRLQLSDKINCLSYLFWNLCWGFEIDTIVEYLYKAPCSSSCMSFEEWLDED